MHQMYNCVYSYLFVCMSIYVYTSMSVFVCANMFIYIFIPLCTVSIFITHRVSFCLFVQTLAFMKGKVFQLPSSMCIQT